MFIIMLLIILILVICAIYLIVIQYNAKKEGISKVEAGPICEVNINEHYKKKDVKYTIWDDFKAPDGKSINKARHRLVEVDGSCMEPQNIKKGDILIYEVLNENFSLRPTDLIILDVQDDEKGLIRKIRRINEILPITANERVLETYYYKKVEGVWKKKRSTINHSFDQVVGLVRYKVSGNRVVSLESCLQ